VERVTRIHTVDCEKHRKRSDIQTPIHTAPCEPTIKLWQLVRHQVCTAYSKLCSVKRIYQKCWSSL